MITDEDINLYITNKLNTIDYSIQIYLDNLINTQLPIHNIKSDETGIIYPTTYTSNNYSYGKFKYKSIKGFRTSNKSNASYILDVTQWADIPSTDANTQKVTFDYTNFTNFSSFPYPLSIVPVRNKFGGLIAKLTNDNLIMDEYNSASFIYNINNIINDYWTTLGDNLNLYGGLFSCDLHIY